MKFFWLDHRLKVREGWCVLPGSEAPGCVTPSAVIESLPEGPRERPDISGRGFDMIGSFRTQALHAALDGMRGSADPWVLVGLMIAALNAQNVRVDGDSNTHYPQRRPSRRLVAAAGLFQDGEMALDEAVLRGAAVDVLKAVLSCEKNATNSGDWGVLVGHIVKADDHLPAMADEDFLKTLSKPGITKAIKEEGILPRNTGKEMRHALMDHVGQGIWVHPAARFQVDVAALNATFAEALAPSSGADDDDGDLAHDDETELEDDADGGELAGGPGTDDPAATDQEDDVPHGRAESPAPPSQTPEEFLRTHVEFVGFS
ncbi:chromosome-partitioning protein parB [Komagataeibacter intermedius AF2]|uniref:Chromosome-partitioning protein parB n=3 Tax=Komagataeibacter intermedius TaxID=66229 RepID=A0A0N1FBU0_9PROT|nr:chromosome-partitioning protein parB [Komagataeibacter intermedius AF2]